MKTSAFATAVLSILVLAGCATGSIPGSVPPGTTIQKAAVISVTAKTFTRAYTGLTVFNNESEEFDIQDWKVDLLIEESGKNALKDLGVASIDNDYSVEQFSPVNDLNGPYDAPAFWGPNWSHVESPSIAYCQKHGLDALIVVAKSRTSDFLTGTNQAFGGVGAYARGPIGSVSVLHMVSYVGIVDCKTGKALATRRLSTSSSDSYRDIIREIPLISLPLTEVKQPASQWTEEQKTRYRDLVSKLPGQALRVTLSKLLNKP